MAEGHKKDGRDVSHVGLTLFHAVGKMAIPHKPDGLAQGDDEMQGHNLSLPTSNGADELERENGAVEGKDVTDNGSKGGKTREDANLVSRETLAYNYVRKTCCVVPSLKYILTYVYACLYERV